MHLYMKSFAAAAAAALCDAILLLLLYQLLLFVILCRIAKFLAGSLNLIPSIVFFLFILQCRIYGLTLPNILGNYRHARSQGGRQPTAAKPPCNIYANICEISIVVCFRSYLFVRTLLAKTLITSTQEGRPEPVVEV